MILKEEITRIKEVMKIGDSDFNNWVLPSLTQLKLEYKVEHDLKGHTFFNSEKDFLNSVKNGSIINVTPKIDSNIKYRSRTKSYEDLISLIKSYRSYPKFRNEKTVDRIYDGFKNNLEMDLPIIIEFPDGSMRVFSGNTRLDIAFQLGIIPKALLIQSNNFF
jgi:hypothetical protein